MNQTKILTKAQAEAVYSAMCAINNLGESFGEAGFRGSREQELIRVQWLESVTIRAGLTGPREEYDDQSAFATAYGLHQG